MLIASLWFAIDIKARKYWIHFKEFYRLKFWMHQIISLELWKLCNISLCNRKWQGTVAYAKGVLTLHLENIFILVIYHNIYICKKNLAIAPLLLGLHNIPWQNSAYSTSNWIYRNSTYALGMVCMLKYFRQTCYLSLLEVTLFNITIYRIILLASINVKQWNANIFLHEIYFNSVKYDFLDFMSLAWIFWLLRESFWKMYSQCIGSIRHVFFFLNWWPISYKRAFK